MAQTQTTYALDKFDFTPFSFYIQKYSDPLDVERAKERVIGLVNDFALDSPHLSYADAITGVVTHLKYDMKFSRAIDLSYSPLENSMTFRYQRDPETGKWYRYDYDTEKWQPAGVKDVTRGVRQEEESERTKELFTPSPTKNEENKTKPETSKTKELDLEEHVRV